MATLSIRNWAEFQHYKNRCPPWIKLHRGLLDNYDFHRLPDASKALAPFLWLLASETESGLIDHDLEKIAFRLHTTPDKINIALKPLIEKGFIVCEQGASNTLAERTQDACLEGETETEIEGETEAALPSASPHTLPVKSSNRGSRIQGDWEPSPSMVAFCLTARKDLDPESVAAEFRDYWIAQPGQKGVKLDWESTWRNWVRRQRAGPKPDGQSKTMQALDNIERQARQ